MKKILIIGGTGFIGSELVKLLNKKFELVVFHNEKIPEELKGYDIKFIRGDVLSLDSLAKCFGGGVDLVINLIGQITPDLELFKKINLIGNKNIIKLIKKHKIVKTILISSVLVYGESSGVASKENRPKKPKTIYSKVKSQVEEIYIDGGINTTILRLSNVYGKGQNKGLMHNLIVAYKENKAIEIPYKNKIRTFINVKDVARAIELTIRKETGKNRVYNIGHTKMSVNDFVSLVERKLNYKFKKIKVRTNDEDEVFVDTELAKKELGFEAKINLEEGIEDAIKDEKIL